MLSEEKHKGYGFVTFSSPADAQDAIDNMDLNELRGKVLRVNLARPTKIPLQPQGNKASTCRSNNCIDLDSDSVVLLVWESEEWLKRYAKPLAQSGGTCDHPPTHMSCFFLMYYVCSGASLRAKDREGSLSTPDPDAEGDGDGDEPMQE